MASKKIKALGIVAGAVAILYSATVSAREFSENVLFPFVDPMNTSVYTQPIDYTIEPETELIVDSETAPIELEALIEFDQTEDYETDMLIEELIDDKEEESEELKNLELQEYWDIIELKKLHNFPEYEGEVPDDNLIEIIDEIVDETEDLEGVITENPEDGVIAETPDPILEEWQNSASEPIEAAYALLARGWEYYPGDILAFGLEDDYIPSVKDSLIHEKGDCEDAVLNIAAAVEDDGYAPLMLGIYAEDNSAKINHMIYPFQDEQGKWGWVDIASRGVGYVTPRFDTVEEMAEDFMRNYSNQSNPYRYYALLDLTSVDQRMDWRTSDDEVKLLMRDVIEHTLPEGYTDS